MKGEALDKNAEESEEHRNRGKGAARRITDSAAQGRGRRELEAGWMEVGGAALMT